MTQIEHRRGLTKHLGFVIFSRAGKVASTIGQLTLHDMRYSFVGGLRCSIQTEQKIHFRMDYGYGIDHQSGIYVGLQEVF